MTKRITTAVIMAAGMGTRFGHKTDDMPKGFIEVGGMPMIVRSLQTLTNCGITRIIIGTGYHQEAYQALRSQFPQIVCVENPIYADTNSMYTLYCCHKALKPGEDFLLLESDLVFERRAIEALLDCEQPDVMLITPVTKFQDQYYVECDAQNRLTRCSVNSDELVAKGELVGIHKLSASFFEKMVNDYELRKAANMKLGYEYQLLHISQVISPVYVLYEEGLAWYEIDDERDLDYAEKNIINRL
jgi:2-aminoethylphosphonate-pyruvate transaminase